MKPGLPLAAFAIPLIVSACVPTPEQEVEVTPPASEMGEDACGASRYAGLVGETSPSITLPAGTIFRHYRTGDPVTMDLNPMRLNFEYDASGKLVSVSCG
ncbi:I78 family peptidase inhibitor [Paracoccus alkanivorans]|uniref:Peptidase inhibitor I78 n=1 Tax=Paracoccus alkanivorans TaxID=2116655 RepID=A0A3M0M9H0_9RHOB|nr:I78 family peptidase inhibitor [Paracoccus alkanivorans]RMC34448.1 hypothetical protein C9E81_13670 [Paracoccus alkanivorans]